MKFRATVNLDGKTATGIVVPEKVVAGLGESKRPPVVVTINGFSYRSTVALMGGEYKLPISAENRKFAGVEAGDKIEVDIVLDDKPRTVEIPSDFAKALSRERGLKKFFDSLSISKQKQLVIPIEAAKTPDTRERRIAKAIETLRVSSQSS